MKLFHNGKFLILRLILAQMFNPRYNKTPGYLVNFKGPWHRPFLYSNVPLIGSVVIGTGVAYNYSLWWGILIPLIFLLLIAGDLGMQMLIHTPSKEELVRFVYEAYPGLIGDDDE